MSRLLSLLLVAFFAALVASPVAAVRHDDLSKMSNEEVDFLAAEEAADENSGLQASESAESAEAAESVTQIKKQAKELSSEDEFSLEAFAHSDEATPAAKAVTQAKSDLALGAKAEKKSEFSIHTTSKQTPNGIVVSHSARVESPSYNPSKHRGQRALKFYCDFKHCHPHGKACFESCTKLREGQPRVDCHAHCNAVRKKCFDCCHKAKLSSSSHSTQSAKEAIAKCNGYTEFCLQYPPPVGVTDNTKWVRSACISIQKKKN
jgi:hypothetical protein